MCVIRVSGMLTNEKKEKKKEQNVLQSKVCKLRGSHLSYLVSFEATLCKIQKDNKGTLQSLIRLNVKGSKRSDGIGT